MAITTIVQHWQSEVATYTSEQTAAQTALTGAQAQLTAANAKLATDTTAFSQTVTDIASWRAQLATTTVPADALALIQKIRDRIIDQRHLQGTLLDDGDMIAATQADVDTATAEYARASQKLADATARLASAQTDATQRQAVITALGGAPLSTIVADANAVLTTGTTYNNATAQITANFPPAVQTLAAARRSRRVGRMGDLQSSVANSANALGTAYNDGSAAGLADQAAITFEQADREARTFVQTAKLRFDHAVMVMQQLEAIKLNTTGAPPDILTGAEKAQLTTASTAVTANAMTQVNKIDADRQQLYASMSALDGAILTQINTDVDALSTSATVQAARGTVTTNAGTLNGDVTAFPAPDKASLDQMEAVVPDDGWSALLDFEEADATLNWLKNLPAAKQPTGLVTALQNAEADYATKLAAAAKAQRRVDYLLDEVSRRQDLLDAATSARPIRLRSAIRGDNF